MHLARPRLSIAIASIALVTASLAAACDLGLPTAPDPIDGGGLSDVVIPEGGADGGLPSCLPNVTGFRPTEWHTPSGAHQNRCTDPQSTELAECAANENPSACLTFKNTPANAACYACAVTSTLSATYGPIVDDGYFTPNTEGCIALVSNDASPSGCGARMRANAECSYYGCQACQDPKSFDDCTTYASSVTCATYDTACSKPYEQQCLTAPSYKELLLRLIKLFCGP